MSSMSIVSRVNRIALVAGVLLLGCGSSSGGGDPAGPFAGTWTFNSGSMIEPMCSGATVPNQDLTGDMLTITTVDTTHIKLSSTGGIDCNVNFTVSGSTATVEPGQMCSTTISGAVVSFAITSWTIGLSGNMLTTALVGTANVVIVTCTPTGSATLSRTGGTDASAG